MPPRDDKRLQIIDAALTEFEERGFAGAGVDRIAACAGVSKRTIYNHFEGKEALFREILDQMAAHANSAVAETFDPTRPLREQLFALGLAEGALLLSPQFLRLVRIVIGEAIRDRGMMDALSARMDHIAVFKRFFRDAAAAGALDAPDPERIAMEFVGMIKSQAFWPVAMTGDALPVAKIERIVASSVETILRAYARQ